MYVTEIKGLTRISINNTGASYNLQGTGSLSFKTTADANSGITFSDGRSTRACPDHLWKVHCASWGRAKKHNHSSWKIIDTRTIAKMLDMKSHKNRLSIPLFTPDLTSDDISLPIHPYLMGSSSFG